MPKDLMDLNEAIELEEDISNSSQVGLGEANRHEQLGKWLKELRDYRSGETTKDTEGEGLKEPTKDNFLRLIDQRIAEYRAEEELDEACRGALAELKCLRGLAKTFIKENSRAHELLTDSIDDLRCRTDSLYDVVDLLWPDSKWLKK